MPWFIERVLENGYFYYGSLAGRGRDGPMATFDVDKPTHVLLPYSKGMDEFGVEWNGRLPAMQTKRIAWAVEEVCMGHTNEVRGGQNEHRGFASEGMVAGMWKLRGTEPRRYNLC
jgi:hypothetical protein